MKERLRAARGQDGFTLIELLIVIVILGVLAGVVVFAVGAFDDQGENAAKCADAKALEVAQEAYKAKTGGYATDAAALVTAKYLRSAPTSGVTTNNTGAISGAPAAADCGK